MDINKTDNPQEKLDVQKLNFPFEIYESEDEVIRILVRSKDDYLFAGVIGGLAYYWNIDSTLLRFLFLISVVVTGGFTILVYLLLAKLLPMKHDNHIFI